MSTGNKGFDEMMAKIRSESVMSIGEDIHQSIESTNTNDETNEHEFTLEDIFDLSGVSGVVDSLVDKGWNSLAEESEDDESKTVSNAENTDDAETDYKIKVALGTMMQEVDSVKFESPVDHYEKHQEIFQYLKTIAESGLWDECDVPYMLVRLFDDCMVYDEAVVLAEQYEEAFSDA